MTGRAGTLAADGRRRASAERELRVVANDIRAGSLLPVRPRSRAVVHLSVDTDCVCNGVGCDWCFVAWDDR